MTYRNGRDGKKHLRAYRGGAGGFYGLPRPDSTHGVGHFPAIPEEPPAEPARPADHGRKGQSISRAKGFRRRRR